LRKVVLIKEREGEIYYPYEVTCRICGRFGGGPYRTLEIAKAVAVRHLKGYHLKIELTSEEI